MHPERFRNLGSDPRGSDPGVGQCSGMTPEQYAWLVSGEPSWVSERQALSLLVRDLDDLASRSKSVFPGRVLLPRKKAHEIVDRMSEQLRAVGERTNVPPFEAFMR